MWGAVLLKHGRIISEVHASCVCMFSPLHLHLLFGMAFPPSPCCCRLGNCTSSSDVSACQMACKQVCVCTGVGWVCRPNEPPPYCALPEAGHAWRDARAAARCLTVGVVFGLCSVVFGLCSVCSVLQCCTRTCFVVQGGKGGGCSRCLKWNSDVRGSPQLPHWGGLLRACMSALLLLGGREGFASGSHDNCERP